MASIGQTKQWNSVVPRCLEQFRPVWRRTSWGFKNQGSTQTVDMSSPQNNAKKHTSLSYAEVSCATFVGPWAAEVLIWEKDGHLLEFLKPSDNLIQLALAERDSLKPCHHISIFGHTQIPNKPQDRNCTMWMFLRLKYPKVKKQLHKTIAKKSAIIKYKWLSWEPPWYSECIYEANSSQKYAKPNPKP